MPPPEVKRMPRPKFLDKLNQAELDELATYLVDHDREYVNASEGRYSATGYAVRKGLARLLKTGPYYTE